MHHRNNNLIPRHRNGTVLVCVLVCVAVASALVVGATRSALRTHRQLRVQRQLRQTELLAEAAVERAIRQLGHNVQYRGETWELSPHALPEDEAASARIAVTPLPKVSPTEYRIVVTARLGPDSPDPIRRSIEIIVPAGPDNVQVGPDNAS
jgi:Tfp pilus assembly protein PilX